jgi:muramoyltetrapeptide carboxypeptidase
MANNEKPILNPGDQIGIVAPSGPFKKIRLVSAIKYFEQAGYQVKLGDFIYKSDRYLAGSAKERTQDLHRMFKTKSIKAIFSARGGYGTTQMLPLLNYDLIQENAKPLFGFSDTTALQIALFEKIKLPTISGMSLCSDFTIKGTPKYTKECFERVILTSSFEDIPLKSKTKHAPLQGKLIGGCLSLVSALCGTEYQPTFKDRILFLEDVKEEPYSVDRMLVQISQQKDFHQLKCIIFGEFYKCEAENPKYGTVETVLKKFAEAVKIPVFFNLPYGHQPARCQIPIGVNAKITSNSTLVIDNFKLSTHL